MWSVRFDDWDKTGLYNREVNADLQWKAKRPPHQLFRCRGGTPPHYCARYHLSMLTSG